MKKVVWIRRSKLLSDTYIYFLLYLHINSANFTAQPRQGGLKDSSWHPAQISRPIRRRSLSLSSHWKQFQAHSSTCGTANPWPWDRGGSDSPGWPFRTRASSPARSGAAPLTSITVATPNTSTHTPAPPTAWSDIDQPILPVLLESAQQAQTYQP